MAKSWLEIDYWKIIKSVKNKKILEVGLSTQNGIFNKPNNKIPIIFIIKSPEMSFV